MTTNRLFNRNEALPDFSGMLIAGVDEAGRGALAGPVIASVIVFSCLPTSGSYQDSKKLNSATRTELSLRAKREAVGWAIGRAEVEEIDAMNVLNATLLAMARAVVTLEVMPDLVLIDGNHAPEIPFPCYTIIGGDSRVTSISAASILAKVERDSEMMRWHRHYPDYNFASHKGYPTKEHIRNLNSYGVSDIHRRSYRPVKERLNGGKLTKEMPR